MLTCKEFVDELSDYLDENTDAALKAKLEKHMAACPNCWVVCDTTRKTIKVIRDHECGCSTLPADVESRLMAAIERKMAAKSKHV